MSLRRSTNNAAKKSKRARAGAGARKPIGAGALPVPRELLSAGVPLDADIEIERQQRMETLKAALMRKVDAGQGAEAIDSALAGMMALEREVERLAWRILRANRFRFGRSSEKLSQDDLVQLLLALGGDGMEAESAVVPTPEAPAQGEEENGESDPASTTSGQNADGERAKPKKKRRRAQRIELAPNVERNVEVVPLPEDERTCCLCGRKKKVFDHIEHEVIRFVPAKIVVDVEKREKAGCSHCRQDMSVAPRTNVPNVVRRVDASLLAKLVSDKTKYALPVERQRRQLRDLGVGIPDKTLASYWAYTTDLLEPVAVATLSAVFGEEVVGLDDSHLKTLDKSSRNGVFRGHIWCFVGTDSARDGPERVGYGYTQSWEAEEIVPWVNAIDGFYQCDGYAGYSSGFDDGAQSDDVRPLIPNERRLGCSMHARSKFHDALLAKDKRAAVPLKFFSEIYKIEAECKEQQLDAHARGEVRRRRSLPLLDAMDAWVDGIHESLLPKSPLRRATTYAINQRPFIRRCFEDGRFEIDQGRVERRIRNFAVGRRNYLFTGSVRGGERLALAYTLVDNCTILGVDAYSYLLDVITKLEAGWRMRRLSELIPWNWATTHQP